MVGALQSRGYLVFDHDDRVAAWAEVARQAGMAVAADPVMQRDNLRHGQTWFVGVDALPNESDGSVAGVPLAGPWDGLITPPQVWHRAQLSIVYPGYPQQDPDESLANHKFRVNRCAAHVDGLLPIGATRRRYLREPHAFVLGLPLNVAAAAPLMVWPGSHLTMGQALCKAIGNADPAAVDLTDAYAAARRRVFDSIDPVPVLAAPGQAVLLHRHLLHGVAPWHGDVAGQAIGRMIAYFRPEFDAGGPAWIARDPGAD